jgi:hypothetical protein
MQRFTLYLPYFKKVSRNHLLDTNHGRYRVKHRMVRIQFEALPYRLWIPNTKRQPVEEP